MSARMLWKNLDGTLSLQVRDCTEEPEELLADVNAIPILRPLGNRVWGFDPSAVQGCLCASGCCRKFRLKQMSPQFREQQKLLTCEGGFFA